MKRTWLLVLLMSLVFFVGCGIPAKGLGFSTETIRATKEALAFSQKHALIMHQAASGMYDSQEVATITVFKATLDSEGAPGIKVVNGKEVMVQNIGVGRVKELLDFYNSKIREIQEARRDEMEIYQTASGVYENAIAIQDALARYLIEISGWDQRQRDVLTKIVGFAVPSE